MTTSNGKNEEPKEIDVEIVSDAPATSKPESGKKYQTFFHPLSGLAILLVDWVAFGFDLPTGFVALPIACLGAFVATFAGVYLIQRREAGDNPARARWKAMLGGIAAGVPFPITGTILGAGILLLSGLPISAKSAVLDIFKAKK